MARATRPTDVPRGPDVRVPAPRSWRPVVVICHPPAVGVYCPARAPRRLAGSAPPWAARARQASPKALYGAWSSVPPFAPGPSSIATSRARSLGESASSATARASTVPAFAVSAVLVQPLVQPADGLDVTPCSDKRFGCVGS